MFAAKPGNRSVGVVETAISNNLWVVSTVLR